jgi:hypothetical protein
MIKLIVELIHTLMSRSAKVNPFLPVSDRWFTGVIAEDKASIPFSYVGQEGQIFCEMLSSRVSASYFAPYSSYAKKRLTYLIPVLTSVLERKL